MNSAAIPPAAEFTVSPSRTLVVPLPATIVGQATDGAGVPMVDGAGDPVIVDEGSAILDAIYALAQEMRDMSGTIQQQVEAITAQLQADHVALEAKITSIQTLIQGMVPGSTLSQADIDALKAAAAGVHSDVQGLQHIATTTSTATAT